MRRSILALFVVLSVLATGCGGDDADSTSPVPTDTTASTDTTVDDSAESGDGIDECGAGQAFPDDPDFREALCRPLMAMIDLIGTDAEILPEWNTRVQNAILAYPDDRAASMDELAAVLAEIHAAG